MTHPILTLFKHTLVNDFTDFYKVIGKPAKLIDVGPGVRPFQWPTVRRHICIEPCALYASVLREEGYTVIEKRAAEGLRVAPESDLVVMLDCIEHMEKAEGLEAIEEAKKRAPRVIVYTPLGFMEQTKDGWGLQQHDWQTHRSGWLPEEFPGWKIMEWKEGFAAIYG